MKLLALLLLAVLPAVENDKVVATEQRLQPGERYALNGDAPALIVFTSAGVMKAGAEIVSAKPGGIWFTGPAKPRELSNAGRAELRFVRVDFRGPGAPDVWGAAGLSPRYKVLLENRYARIYDIRIPAETREPQHTHKARIVICLSGAELRHLMPDGHEETSTLETGEIAWRPGSTHIGQNIGKTDLWAIAVEPK